MKHYKYTIIAFLAIVIIGTPWLITTYPRSMVFINNAFDSIENNFAAVFFRESITISQLQNKYDAVSKKYPKVRIMIVPGHEPDFGGTEFKDLKERDMTVELSKQLEVFFKNNSHYEVIIARDQTAWNPDLKKYFDENWDAILDFVKENKNEMVRLVNGGSVTKVTDGMYHNAAPRNVALRLYGINKWNNENNIDIAIHVHFNDYPRKNPSVAGKYSGLSIYVPEKQYSNSTTTRAIADTVFKRLSKYNPISNLPKETDGIIEEQELIAIGSYNTLDAPSMLIEYGYIYEPQFADKNVRDSTFRDLAFQTYLGIQDFFGSGNDVSLTYDTLMLPYKWENNINRNTLDKNPVLALQSALILEGLYPPREKNKNDCPRTGKFGPCTIEALSTFQKKYGINGENEMVGEQTKKILNEKYSGFLN